MMRCCLKNQFALMYRRANRLLHAITIGHSCFDTSARTAGSIFRTAGSVFEAAAIKSALIAALLAAAALVGCGSSPKANFYTLGPGAAPARAEAKASYRIAIGAVTVPDALSRPQIVTRAGANQVTINEFERWAGPLKDEIARALAANLTQLLAGASVFAYPQSANVEADYKVFVDVQRFDSAPGDAATVEALWQVRPAKGEPKFGRSIAREATQGKDYDALVAAHGRALAAVSRDIAAAIRAAGTATR